MKTETLDSIRREIHGVISRFNKRIPAQAINTLFVAIPYDESTLTQEILGYLLENNYEALETPTGQSLRERLTSTDWSLKEKDEVVEPKEPTAPVTATPSSAPAQSASIKLSRSDSVLVGLVLVLVVILSWLWRHKMSEMAQGTVEEDTAPVATAVQTPAKPTDLPAIKNHPSVRSTTPVTTLVPVGDASNQNADVSQPAQAVALPVAEPTVPEKTIVKSYDEVDDRVGDFGLRAARKGSKWGYVSQNDAWQIEPVYDDVTPFQNGKAAVILDGQSIQIDRNGSRIRADE